MVSFQFPMLCTSAKDYLQEEYLNHELTFTLDRKKFLANFIASSKTLEERSFLSESDKHLLLKPYSDELEQVDQKIVNIQKQLALFKEKKELIEQQDVFKLQGLGILNQMYPLECKLTTLAADASERDVISAELRELNKKFMESRTLSDTFEGPIGKIDEKLASLQTK